VRLGPSWWRRLRPAGFAALAAAAVPALVLAALAALFPFPQGALTRPAATMVVDARGEPLRFFLAPDEAWRFPVRLADVPEPVVRVFVASEDKRFWSHPGVDPLALARAVAANLAAGRVVSGASTIPMQVSRLAEPRPRTIIAKLIEAGRALELTLRYPKAELLERYLNLLPFGGNIEGLGAASRFYCGKPPAALSLGEAALLAVIPRAPGGFDPIRRPAAARAARDGLLDRLAADGVFTAEEVARAQAQALPTRLSPLPLIAPHFCELAATRLGRGGTLRTLLDADLQRRAESLLRRRVSFLREQGLENAAAVVVDLAGGGVRAMVGAADYLDGAHHGFINAATVRRSPGSALKPFLYAYAFEEGRLSPESFLLDLPTDFAGYTARNYDGTYAGRVTVTEALRRSLNAPAVRLLAEVGVPEFLALLRRAGLSSLDRLPGSYGLPLVLGAGEVTLLELTAAYAALARGGTYLAPRLSPAEDPQAARIFSPGACELLSGILAGVERPDLPQAWELTRDIPAVAWKTGTSYGHRDAWALGFSGRYAVGVWVGNLDGTPVAGISGAHHAGPLLFDLFRAVEPSGATLAHHADPDLALVEVCAESRELPGPDCTERIRVPILAGRAPLPRCRLHRRIFVDAASGERLAGDCLAEQPAVSRVVCVYPPELAAFWRSQGQDVPGLPAPSPLCAASGDGEPPAIVSPSPATPYRLRRDAPLDFQQLRLSARAAPDAGSLTWYEDGRLVAQGPSEARLFLIPRPGRHRLVVLDERGRMDVVSYAVED